MGWEMFAILVLVMVVVFLLCLASLVISRSRSLVATIEDLRGELSSLGAVVFSLEVDGQVLVRLDFKHMRHSAECRGGVYRWVGQHWQPGVGPRICLVVDTISV